MTIYQPEEWSLAEMMMEYAERKGYGHPADNKEARALIKEHEPLLYEVILTFGASEATVDILYEFLSNPPGLIRDDDGSIVVTEHGHKIAMDALHALGEGA